MTRIVVGADVGGSKTSVAVAEGENVLGRAEGPGAAIRPGRALASAMVISEVVRRALAVASRTHCDLLVVGAAGAGRETERDELRQALRQEGFSDRVHVTTDIEIALLAAFGDGPGIVLTAGTGSIAIARDPHGRSHRCGGFGWQMGDEGSGYAIGRAALGAVSRAHEGRSPKTILTQRVLEATRADSMDALIRWAGQAGVAEVAALAPAVIAAAGAADTVAQGILDYAARELTHLVLHLLPHFGADERMVVEVAANGGLLVPTSPLYTMLRGKLAEEPRLKLRETPIDPPLGAVALGSNLLTRS